MRVAMLAPIAWRTPPRNYGPWEKVTSILTENLVKRGIDVTLFATGDSLTSAKLQSSCPEPYEQNKNLDAKVEECMHISHLMENADQFDIVHNQFDFLPLTYSSLIKPPMVTTIHGFSSNKIIPVYEKYNNSTSYVSISDSDRHDSIRYIDTIYHGIDGNSFTFKEMKEDFLLFYGRIHRDKGAHTAIEIAKRVGKTLIIAGLVQDAEYYDKCIAPEIDGVHIKYVGNLSQTEGNDILGKALALLHPIYFDEPFGLSVAESLMCGTPVIAFNRGSMPELIENGRTGFLVKSVEEAVQAISKISSIDNRLCRSEALKKFSIEVMVDKYINVYERILAR
ncbi:mannose-6-phosphate isomerase type 2 [Flavobacteriaceae bacterium MAR_2009_75]|nr:mannose-6-phosphate isomerase type 2 [Flavobacteriaceae bacterium MAR_2009_75]